MWQPDEPFNELEPPPSDELETKPVLKATTAARSALAALNQAMLRIPNPSILLGAIPLLEAQASSEIENIVTTTDALFESAESPQSVADFATKETLRYRSALFAGVSDLATRPLSQRTASLVCTQVNGHEMRVRHLPGTFIGNPVTKHARYTPPEGESRIVEKLSDWETFIHSSPELDPLVVMAAAHYQFEAIHPFTDGNGRTGRILNVLVLLSLGLLNEPVLYLSRYFIEHKDDYYDRLLAVTRDHDWEGWLLFVLEGVRATAEQTLRLIDNIESLRQSYRELLRSTPSPIMNADLLEVLFEQPYCRISNVVDRCSVSRQTAAKWLRNLVDLDVLQERKVGRDVIFVNHALMRVLQNGD